MVKTYMVVKLKLGKQKKNSKKKNKEITEKKKKLIKRSFLYHMAGMTNYNVLPNENYWKFVEENTLLLIVNPDLDRK